MRSLAEVRAASAYGSVKRRSNKELAAWWRRLAFDLGALEPVEVEVPKPGPEASPQAREAADGFALLLGLRRTDHAAEPVAFSVRFCAAWCALSKDAAARAIRELRELDVIRVVAQHGSLALYEPGDGPRSGRRECAT